MSHIKANSPLQFNYQANHSTEDIFSVTSYINNHIETHKCQNTIY